MRSTPSDLRLACNRDRAGAPNSNYGLSKLLQIYHAKELTKRAAAATLLLAVAPVYPETCAPPPPAHDPPVYDHEADETDVT